MACKSVESIRKELDALRDMVTSLKDDVNLLLKKMESAPDGEPIEEFLFMAADKETVLASTSDLNDEFLSSIGLAMMLNEFDREEEKIYTPYTELKELKEACRQREDDIFKGFVK